MPKRLVYSSPDHPGSSSRRRDPECQAFAMPRTERQQLAYLLSLTANEGRNEQGSISSEEPSVESKKMKRAKNVSRINRPKNKSGETQLHLSATKGDLDMTKSLIRQGADVNCRDNADWTPLHEACNHGHYKVAKYLLRAGAKVNVQGFDGDTPLHDASSNGHLKIVLLLLRHGGDPRQKNNLGTTPIELADSERVLEAQQNFTKDMLVDLKPIKDFTPEPQQLDSSRSDQSPRKFKRFSNIADFLDTDDDSCQSKSKDEYPAKSSENMSKLPTIKPESKPYGSAHDGLKPKLIAKDHQSLPCPDTLRSSEKKLSTPNPLTFNVNDFLFKEHDNKVFKKSRPLSLNQNRDKQSQKSTEKKLKTKTSDSSCDQVKKRLMSSTSFKSISNETKDIQLEMKAKIDDSANRKPEEHSNTIDNDVKSKKNDKGFTPKRKSNLIRLRGFLDDSDESGADDYAVLTSTPRLHLPEKKRHHNTDEPSMKKMKLEKTRIKKHKYHKFLAGKDKSDKSKKFKTEEVDRFSECEIKDGSVLDSIELRPIKESKDVEKSSDFQEVASTSEHNDSLRSHKDSSIESTTYKHGSKLSLTPNEPGGSITSTFPESFDSFNPLFVLKEQSTVANKVSDGNIQSVKSKDIDDSSTKKIEKTRDDKQIKVASGHHVPQGEAKKLDHDGKTLKVKSTSKQTKSFEDRKIKLKESDLCAAMFGHITLPKPKSKKSNIFELKGSKKVHQSSDVTHSKLIKVKHGNALHKPIVNVKTNQELKQSPQDITYVKSKDTHGKSYSKMSETSVEDDREVKREFADTSSLKNMDNPTVVITKLNDISIPLAKSNNSSNLFEWKQTNEVPMEATETLKAGILDRVMVEPLEDTMERALWNQHGTKLKPIVQHVVEINENLGTHEGKAPKPSDDESIQSVKSSDGQANQLFYSPLQTMTEHILECRPKVEKHKPKSDEKRLKRKIDMKEKKLSAVCDGESLIVVAKRHKHSKSADAVMTCHVVDTTVPQSVIAVLKTNDCEASKTGATEVKESEIKTEISLSVIAAASEQTSPSEIETKVTSQNSTDGGLPTLQIERAFLKPTIETKSVLEKHDSASKLTIDKTVKPVFFSPDKITTEPSKGTSNKSKLKDAKLKHTVPYGSTELLTSKPVRQTLTGNEKLSVRSTIKTKDFEKKANEMRADKVKEGMKVKEVDIDLGLGIDTLKERELAKRKKRKRWLEAKQLESKSVKSKNIKLTKTFDVKLKALHRLQSSLIQGAEICPPFKEDLLPEPCTSFEIHPKIAEGGKKLFKGESAKNLKEEGKVLVKESGNKDLVKESTSKEFIKVGTPKELIKDGTSKELIKDGTPKELIKDDTPKELIKDGTPTELIKDGPPKELIKVGTPKELIKDGTPKELFKQGTPTELIKDGTPKELIIDGTPKELDKEGTPKELVKKATTKELVKKGTPKEFVIQGTPKELIKDGTSKELIKEGTPTELIIDDTSKESVKEGTPKELIKDGTPKELIIDGTSTELVKEGTLTELIIDGTSKELIKDGTSKELIKQGTPKELINEGTLKDLIKDGTPKELIKDGTPKELIKDGTSKELIKQGTPKDLIKDGTPKELVKEGTSKELIKDGTPKELIKDGTPKELIKDGTPKELIKDGKPKELIKEGTPKELIKDGTSKELIKEGTPKELIKDGTPKELIKDDTFKDLIKGGTSRDLPKESLTKNFVEESLTKDLVEEHASINLFKETLAKDLIKENLRKDMVEESASINSVKGSLANDLVKQSLDKDIFKGISAKDLVKESATRDVLKETLVKDLVKESADKESFTGSSAKDLVKESVNRDVSKQTLVTDLVKESANREIFKGSSDKDLVKESVNRDVSKQTLVTDLVKESANRDVTDLIKESANNEILKGSSDKDLVKESVNKEIFKGSLAKDLVKESAKMDDLKESLVTDLVKESANRDVTDLIKENVNKEIFKGSSAKELVKESANMNVLKESLVTDLIKESVNKDILNKTLDKDIIKESNNKDTLKETFVKYSVNEFATMDMVKESLTKNLVKQDSKNEIVKEGIDKDLVKDSNLFEDDGLVEEATVEDSKKIELSAEILATVSKASMKIAVDEQDPTEAKEQLKADDVSVEDKTHDGECPDEDARKPLEHTDTNISSGNIVERTILTNNKCFIDLDEINTVHVKEEVMDEHGEESVVDNENENAVSNLLNIEEESDFSNICVEELNSSHRETSQEGSSISFHYSDLQNSTLNDNETAENQMCATTNEPQEHARNEGTLNKGAYDDSPEVVASEVESSETDCGRSGEIKCEEIIVDRKIKLEEDIEEIPDDNKTSVDEKENKFEPNDKILSAEANSTFSDLELPPTYSGYNSECSIISPTTLKTDAFDQRFKDLDEIDESDLLKPTKGGGDFLVNVSNSDSFKADERSNPTMCLSPDEIISKVADCILEMDDSDSNYTMSKFASESKSVSIAVDLSSELTDMPVAAPEPSEQHKSNNYMSTTLAQQQASNIVYSHGKDLSTTIDTTHNVSFHQPVLESAFDSEVFNDTFENLASMQPSTTTTYSQALHVNTLVATMSSMAEKMYSPKHISGGEKLYSPRTTNIASLDDASNRKMDIEPCDIVRSIISLDLPAIPEKPESPVEIAEPPNIKVSPLEENQTGEHTVPYTFQNWRQVLKARCNPVKDTYSAMSYDEILKTLIAVPTYEQLHQKANDNIDLLDLLLQHASELERLRLLMVQEMSRVECHSKLQTLERGPISASMVLYLQKDELYNSLNSTINFEQKAKPDMHKLRLARFDALQDKYKTMKHTMEFRHKMEIDSLVQMQKLESQHNNKESHRQKYVRFRNKVC